MSTKIATFTNRDPDELDDAVNDYIEKEEDVVDIKFSTAIEPENNDSTTNVIFSAMVIYKE